MRPARSRRRCQAFPAHPMRTSLRPLLRATYLRGRCSQRADRVDRPFERAGRGRLRQPLQGRRGHCYLAAALQALPLHLRRKTDCCGRQVRPLGHCGGTRRYDPRRCHLPDHGFARARLCIDCGEITQQPTESRAPIQPAPTPAPPAGGVSYRNCTAARAAVLTRLCAGNLATHASSTATETVSPANDPKLAGRSTADPVSLSQGSPEPVNLMIRACGSAGGSHYDQQRCAWKAHLVPEPRARWPGPFSHAGKLG
jgi:hypothetical protein